MNKTKSFLIYGSLIVLCLLFFLPVLVTFCGSFMGSTEINRNFSTATSVFQMIGKTGENFKNMSLIPNPVTLAQYKTILLDNPSILILLKNSLTITIPIVVGNLLVSLFTAYGFTIWSWKYKELIFNLYTIVMLMPLQALLVPNYLIADFLGIKESYAAIILPGIFSPFGTFLLRQGLKGIPQDYFEAATIDGANSFKTFIYVLLPQCKSTVAALVLLVFCEYWNLVEQAIIFIKDYAKEPLSIYLSRLSEGRMDVIFAASFIFLIPPLWMLIVGQDDLEKGIEYSGIK